MARTGLFLTIGLMLLLPGCAAKRTARVKLIVEPRCLEGPVVMIDCDANRPPHCKKSVITIKSGCEYVVVKK